MVTEKFLSDVIARSQSMAIMMRQMVAGSFCLLVEDINEYAPVERLLAAYHTDYRIARTVEDVISTLTEDADKVICVVLDLHFGKDLGEEVIQEVERINQKIPIICHTPMTELGSGVKERYPRVNVVLKGDSMYDLISALGLSPTGV